jgi:hypothetical protein
VHTTMPQRRESRSLEDFCIFFFVPVAHSGLVQIREEPLPRWPPPPPRPWPCLPQSRPQPGPPPLGKITGMERGEGGGGVILLVAQQRNIIVFYCVVINSHGIKL